MRDLAVPGLLNARDLGGVPRASGGVTPRGVFLRSENTDLVGDAGWSLLRAAGVRTIVDLRQEVERAAAPDGAPADMERRDVDHDGLQDRPDFWKPYWDSGLVGTPAYLLPHIEAMPERTVAVLSAIATAPPGAVLTHCAAGRDRTGLVAAVLLRIAGVPDAAILDDWLQSLEHTPDIARAHGLVDPEPSIAALLAEHGTDSATAFRAFLDGLEVEPLLAALPADEAEALRTWRGTLTPVG